MIKKILVALDDGETCQIIFEQALELAQSTQSKLNLISVLPLENHDIYNVSPYSDSDWQAYAKRYQRAQVANLKLLKRFANTAEAVGIDTRLTQDTGNPGSAICRQAKTWSADLIIVGSHGRKGLSEMLLGSVSNYVMHHAPCSVMVIHGKMS